MSDQADGSLPGLPGREPVPGLDTAHAHSARVYNYWRGGKDNYEADRAAAEQANAANPGVLAHARAHRALLPSAPRHLAGRQGSRHIREGRTAPPTPRTTHGGAQGWAAQ